MLRPQAARRTVGVVSGTWHQYLLPFPPTLTFIWTCRPCSDVSSSKIANYQKEVGLQYKGSEEEYAWHSGAHRRRFSVFPRLTGTINWQIQQLQPGKNVIIRASNPSVMTACVNPSVKPPTAAEVIAQGEGNPESVVEEGDNEYQLPPWGQL